ncbi:MAG TPA: primosomal protein N', partial [Gammaproteobacteria bacterium]
MPDRPDYSATANSPIWHIAIPAPLHRGFDYRAPLNTLSPPVPGMRVRVPFGTRKTIGVLLETRAESAVSWNKLKPILQVIDTAPVLTSDLLALGRWASDYYHHPIGEVLHHMLPTLLRQGQEAALQTESIWRVSTMGANLDSAKLVRAPKQQALLKLLQQNREGLTADALNAHLSQWRAPLQLLLKKALVECETVDCAPPAAVLSPPPTPQRPPELNADQQQAVAAISATLGSFHRWLLEGVTGSGKTEVYLQIITQVLARGDQALVLVPEIGLTPQLLQRFAERLSTPVGVIHSNLSERQRLNTWVAAKNNETRVIIGTRSGIFTPLARPGVIIVDEEHDQSFKQQDGFRYHARDLAIVRAQQLNIPIILGSATPSLESFYNLQQSRYRRLHLPTRTGQAQLPHISVVDARQTPAGQAVSPVMRQRVEQHLNAGNQVLIFLNRRGYAP